MVWLNPNPEHNVRFRFEPCSEGSEPDPGQSSYRTYKLKAIAYLGFSCRGGSSFAIRTPCTVKTASSASPSAVDINKRQDFGFTISLTSKRLVKFFISCVRAMSHYSFMYAINANQSLLCRLLPTAGHSSSSYSQTHSVPACFLQFGISLLPFQRVYRLTCVLCVVTFRQHVEHVKRLAVYCWSGVYTEDSFQEIFAFLRFSIT